MIALQVISKILATGSLSIIEDNLLDKSYFPGYEAEFEFIQDHANKYGNVPDTATFLAKFPQIELVECTESDKYLVDTIREENLYYRAVPVVQKIAELLKSDSNAAAEYMVNALKELQPNYQLGGINIVSQADDRYEQFLSRRDHQDQWFFTTGFEELDGLIHGIQREEELFVIFARTNQGKSWVLEKMCTHVWQLGFNVGYISSEMSATSIGYRFDTLYKNFSNTGLQWGKDDVDEKAYENYLKTLKTTKNKFMVATPLDFDNQITVPRLKNWVKQYQLDLLAIDGITYVSDARGKRGDNKTTTLTNISEDLMSLSMELKIPVLIVVQANRTGATEDESVPELESIRDSDGIAHNASKVLSIRQTKDRILKMEIKKQRFGAVGGKLSYSWSINTGEFMYVPAEDDAQPIERKEQRIREVKRSAKKDIEDVF